jgi:hypothetical protein
MLVVARWGESVSFSADISIAVTMVLQGLDQLQAERIWRPLMENPDTNFTGLARCRIYSSAVRRQR